ncbi:hypothetical protein RJ640_019739 [Escallonia rubra]|uniref:Transcription repressor n=1 Tax=Escallonia rubra TaxID=112253 RepID=A0AA88U757_9ASTE|nr:hypothetical protein RJ640_019739 [Escallonia rubra]
MPNTLGRNLNLCFTKIKRPALLQSPLHQDHSRPSPNPATASSSILVKNFNCLYDPTLDPSSPECCETETTADFATAFASQRFFFSSPGRSNSIIESSSSLSLSSTSSSSTSGKAPRNEELVGGSIAIPTVSPDPYMDFRRSMQEMVEARDLVDVRANWDYLHELLMCYLGLNPKSTHKFIVGAFADLLVTLMSSRESP